ncbi:MAG TPA: zf-HC2 domain-containing protein [Candidatus Sulfotelmatobacter sp.]|jgi:hypothetical protein
MVNKDAIRCEQVWLEVSNYVEGDLDAGLRAAMDAHFLTCAKCRSVLDGMRNVIQLYGDERMIEVPAGFSRRLERRIVQSTKIRSRGWSVWSAWLIPAAAMVLIAGGIRIASSATVPHPLRSEHAQPARNIPSDMIVVVSAGAKDFHRPGCDAIHNKEQERTLTAADAIRQGYVPCVRCLRKYLETTAAGRTDLEREGEFPLEATREDLDRGH